MSNKNIFDLDPERLGTTDEHGHRVYMYPEDVKGVWKERRKYFYWFLITIYLILPWFNINGKPAIQIDIFQREFTFLGWTLHGVEPILFFLFVATGLFFIAFITSLFGRVWCGWACPQTVFIQSIFWKIEEFVEGKPKARRELDAAPLNFNKIWKRTVKWTLFFLVSSHIAHTFIGYIVGPRNLLHITLNTPSSHWGLFVATSILTTIFLLDFGWFREQFCIIACPYGRIQSVFLDDNSYVVAYDKNRGEPRFSSVEKGQEGDCVNCYHCVKVCPTGIDIRRGTQLECIHCTQCIDACDAIMDKLKRPKGLIRYASENQLQGKVRKIMTPRSAIYAGIGTVFILAFMFFLNKSQDINMVFIRAKIPFTISQEGKVLNNFQLKLSHQGSEKPEVEFKVKEVEFKDKVELITPLHPTVLKLNEQKIIFFIRFSPEFLKERSKITVQVIDAKTENVLSEKEVSLVGPLVQ